VRPDGSGHVWADFYLENYGWVPVDVTFKLYSPLSGDYFGKVDVEKSGIIFSKEVYLPLQIGDTVQYAPILQHYSWWYWDSGGSGNIYVGNYINSREM
jgi:transglutaminase-like putative cysteine protease